MPVATAGAGCGRAAEMLELPCRSDWNERYPTHCILDGQELGWTAAAGDASELLVVNTWFSLQVTPCSAPHAHLL